MGARARLIIDENCRARGAFFSPVGEKRGLGRSGMRPGNFLGGGGIGKREVRLVRACALAPAPPPLFLRGQGRSAAESCD